MIHYVYAMRDTRVGFMNPFVEVNDSAATRGFENAILSGEGYFARYAGDFDLYRLGEFDTESGVISALSTPAFVVAGSSFKHGVEA